MNLAEKAQELAQILSNPYSSEDLINQTVEEYYEIINGTEDADAVEASMQYLSEIFSIDNLENATTASLICGALVENNYSAKYVTDNYINFFKNTMQKAMPFLKVCKKEISKLHASYARGEGDDEDYENDDEIVDRLKEELKDELKSEIQAFNALDKYYPCGTSIFSSDVQEFIKGKKQLSDVSDYALYSQAFFWLSKLFEVLFFEPVIVIDLNTKKGIKAEMSGIVDNFQLQIMLMGLKELNDTVELNKEIVDVVTGYGPQSIDKTIVGKWNMCNWEHLKADDKKESHSEHWIWSEGNPSHISKFKEHRIILLDKPSYQRGLSVHRVFKNLIAEIHIKKELSQEEVEQLLKELKDTANNFMLN